MPDPDPDPIRTKADRALLACQELDKDLRNRRNKGEATDPEVALIKASIEALRQFSRGRGYPTEDIDRNSDARRAARRRG